jgi:hypothetical protein
VENEPQGVGFATRRKRILEHVAALKLQSIAQLMPRDEVFGDRFDRWEIEDGVRSLVFWSLVRIISVKYPTFMPGCRATPGRPPT